MSRRRSRELGEVTRAISFGQTGRAPQSLRVAPSEIYVADTGGKESVEETEKQLADPENTFDLAPRKLVKLTDFMNASGTIKSKPTSWKEMFFPEVHELSGD